MCRGGREDDVRKDFTEPISEKRGAESVVRPYGSVGSVLCIQGAARLEFRVPDR